MTAGRPAAGGSLRSRSSLGTAEAAGLRLVAHHDLAGNGDGMQLLREGDALYVGHNGTSRMGTSILDVSDPAAPELVAQWPAPEHTHTHKVQIADGLLLINHEKFPLGPKPVPGPFSAGLAIYRLDDPLAPEQVGWWDSGGRGVHRVVYTGGRYAHMSAIPDGFRDRIWVVVDVSDPTAPVEAARFWLPGLHEAGGETPDWPEGERFAAHHALVDGDRAYLGFDDANMVVLDVTDWTAPKQVGHVTWDGGSTHTCLPLPSLGVVAVTDEQTTNGPDAPERLMRLVDPAEERVVSVLPPPDPRYAQGALRFGPHNFHENRDGSYRSERLLFATYFNAGVRVYDVADPEAPREVAFWVSEPAPGQPDPQANDLFVDADGLIWVSDRVGGGVFVLEPEPELEALMREAQL
jgi:hypothetical protein